MAISISLRAESFRRRLVVGLVSVLAVTAALAFGGFRLSRSGLFHARTIEVAGAAYLSESRVVARAAVSEDTNVIWFDDAAAERRLESHPWVADARVSTAFPATIRIVVVERTPVAVVSDRLGDLLLAADGTALGPPERTRGLPRIEVSPTATTSSAGASREAAAAIVGAMTPEIRAQLLTVDVRGDGSVELRLREGVRVGYGSVAQAGRKAAVLARILAWADASGERVVWVSLAAPNAPAVRLAA